MKVALSFVAILVLTSTWVVGQDKKRELQPKPPPVYRQLEQPIPQTYLKLFKPDFPKLNLAGTSSGEEEKKGKRTVEHFNSGSKINFRLIITNASEEQVFGCSEFDSHILNRPQLYRDGELVSYRENVKELLEVKDRRYASRRAMGFAIEPKMSITERVSLDDWYEPLQPARYELSVWHRFIWGGEWLESPSLTFEVAAEGLNKNKVKPSI